MTPTDAAAPGGGLSRELTRARARKILAEVLRGNAAYPTYQAGTIERFNFGFAVHTGHLRGIANGWPGDTVQIDNGIRLVPGHRARHSSPVNERSARLPAISAGKLRTA